MKKKRLAVCAAVSASLLLGTASAATTIDSIEVAEGLVRVSGATDKGGAVTYEVYDADVQKPALKDILGFGEIYPEATGEYSFDFGLKKGGSFTIRIFDGEEKVYGEFAYASEEDRKAFLEGMTEVLKNSDTAAEETDKILSDEDNAEILKTIGVDAEVYSSYDAEMKKEICEKMAKNGKGQTLTEKTFLNLYKDSENLAKINNGDKASVGGILEGYNFSFEDKEYNNEEKAKQEWLKDAMLENAAYESAEDMEEMYAKVSALYEINNAKVSNIESKVNEYADLLEITDESEYKRYKSKADSAVNKKLVNLLEDEALTVGDLLDALDESADASGNSGGGSSGGGGGSTIRGGSTNTTGGYVIQPEEEQEDIPEAAVSEKFSDINSSHWAYEAVSTLSDEGIINGYGDGTFLPEKTVTREEFVKMLVAAFDMEDADANSTFIDVFTSDWFYSYVSAAYEKGIVKGDHLGLFGIGEEITRQDASVMAARAMKAAHYSMEEIRDYDGFNDEAMIADYAKDDVVALYRAGKINGVGNNTFEPQRTCTRAEAATIIYGISR